jgi:hypothetical protein
MAPRSALLVLGVWTTVVAVSADGQGLAEFIA